MEFLLVGCLLAGSLARGFLVEILLVALLNTVLPVYLTSACRQHFVSRASGTELQPYTLTVCSG